MDSCGNKEAGSYLRRYYNADRGLLWVKVPSFEIGFKCNVCFSEYGGLPKEHKNI